MSDDRDNNKTISAFRSVFEQALTDIDRRTEKAEKEGKRCLILSGGVDTCAILAAAKKVGMPFSTGFTVVTGDDSPDLGFATAAAKEHGLKHVVIRLTPKELVSNYLPLLIQKMEKYDGMTLRNGLVVAAAFHKASEMGFTHAITGDGADELFGGYSFMWKFENSPDEWKEKRDSMCQQWTFDTAALAEMYGMIPHSPFAEPSVVKWALENTQRSDCIGTGPIRLVYGGEFINHQTGKMILRQAYETVSSWRRKDPIEVGSGVTVIGHDEYWSDLIGDEEFEVAKTKLLERGYIIKNKEQFYNFSLFEKEFGPNGEACKSIKRLALGKGCVGCCFEVGDKTFCFVCGAYPAQRSSSTAAGEEL